MSATGGTEAAISYPLVLPASRWKRQLKLRLGELLTRLLPGRAARVLHVGDPMHFSGLDRWLVAGWVARARRMRRGRLCCPLCRRPALSSQQQRQGLS